MLMTALLSLTHLQQPQMAMSQLMSEPSVLEQSVATETGLSAASVTSDLPLLSPSTHACGAANNSRKSCGGTGRRVLM